MPCYSPNLAFMHKKVKQPLRFAHRKHYRTSEGIDPYRSDAYLALADKNNWQPVVLPCGQCIFCRLQNSKEKAIRAVHQSKFSPTGKNCFLTLTYSDDFLPKNEEGFSVYSMSHIKGFMDDLRDRLRYDFFKQTGDKKIPDSFKIKSFGCAEYGDKFERPHFHLCLFNYDFSDKKFFRNSSNDWSTETWPVYRSELLEELWPYGISEIGSLTEESAAYVARYVTKKVTGEKRESHYQGRPPERIVCNSKGIGLDYLKKYSNELFNHDSVLWKHQEMKLPRYYQKKLEEMDPLRYAALKEKRLEKIREIDLDSTKERLDTRKKVHEYKALNLKRRLE